MISRKRKKRIKWWTEENRISKRLSKEYPLKRVKKGLVHRTK